MKMGARNIALVSSCLLVMGLQETATRAAGKSKVTCDTCPVAGIDPKGSSAFAQADTSGGCTTQTKIGFPVPDPKCTPGAINPTVTLEVLKNKSYRTACTRNCATLEVEKNAAYGFYSIPHPANNQGTAQTCELDHLVPLELGGADTIDNIWPQCGPNHVALALRYFKQKDMVENYLAAQAKAGKIDLGEAQQGIAGDWTQYLSDAKVFCKQNPKSCSVAD